MEDNKREWCNSWDCEHNKEGYCQVDECPLIMEWFASRRKKESEQ